MARLEVSDWSIKSNIKLELISFDSLINFLIRMDIILLIFGMSFCTFGARVGRSIFPECILSRKGGGGAK